MTASVTIELAGEALSVLDDLAARSSRSRTALVQEAVEDWLARQRAEVAQIEAGLAEADAGLFASDEEVAAVFAKYGARAPRLKH